MSRAGMVRRAVTQAVTDLPEGAEFTAREIADAVNSRGRTLCVSSQQVAAILRSAGAERSRTVTSPTGSMVQWWVRTAQGVEQ